jgi:putative membrane protein
MMIDMISMVSVHLLIVAGIIYLIIKLASCNDSDSRRHAKQAIYIIKDRFARGEITEEEYMRMKDVLDK